jgi:Zn-dependent M28 family amino/carboxypeptidase
VNKIERSSTNNVLAVLPGSDRAEEYVVYMGHWDHFGRDTMLEGDQIYNGARDNATGTAALLEVAGAFAGLDPKPSRSILILAVGGEEQGLLGSAYYAAEPVFPPEKTVAALNIDAMNVWGRTNDIMVVGFGNSELDDYAVEAAEAEGRVIRPDPEVEKGFFYRSDHFSFAKIGVPAFYADPGIDNIEHGEAWGIEQREQYTAERYHKVTDEFSPDWDLTGAVADLRLLFRMGYRMANESTFPNWRDGTEFKATRDSMMAAAM